MVQLHPGPPFQSLVAMDYVYVLKNPKGILYKGQTNNLEKRIHQHNSVDGFSAYTKGRDPWTLVYKEEFTTRSAAKERETFLKSGAGRTFLRNCLHRI